MILVIGTGVAGLTCAIEAAAVGSEVILVTPGSLGSGGETGAGYGSDSCPAADARIAAGLALAGGNTVLAQGGIAAAIGAGDHPALHTADTISAGVGFVDPAAAGMLAAVGAEAVRGLISLGFSVDRDAAGAVSFGLEAAHSRARIVHAGEDRTGAALHSFLRAQLLDLVAEGRVQLTESASAVSLLGDSGAVTGAVLRRASGQLSSVKADAVVLATGGYAALYSETSNHSGARGEGIVLASRLGAVVADLEFVQFHPTVLAGTGILISEAVRGAGAVLRDERSERFMLDAHPHAELAPRDVVSRTVHRSMRASGAPQVWLDASAIEREGGRGTLARRFPAITSAVRAHGIDWACEPVPVAPAAHYTMGGIVTDLHGRTNLPGLFAVGEVACTGVHGANRLASNSLLEGLVFGARAAVAAAGYSGEHSGAYSGAQPCAWELQGHGARGLIARAEQLPPRIDKMGSAGEDLQPPGEKRLPNAIVSRDDTSDREVSLAVSAGLGIERDAEGLKEVSRSAAAHSGASAELTGMIADAAIARTESRGSHQRSDHPETDPALAGRLAWIARSSDLGRVGDLSGSRAPQEMVQPVSLVAAPRPKATVPPVLNAPTDYNSRNELVC